MNAREYIESGTLELYAMGALSPDEMERVGRDVAASAELQAELREISRALESIAPVEGVSPSTGLRDRVLQGISAEGDGAHSGEGPSPQATIPMPVDREITGSTRSPVRTWLMAASLVGFLITGGLAVWFYSQLEETREELAGIEDRVTAAEVAYTRASDELEMLRDHENHIVRMAPASEEIQSFAVLYWNPETRTVWIDAQTMPPLPSGEQYQLWALGEGDPVDAGVFDGSTEGLQKLKEVEEAHGFAVTVEPEGGSETPTLDRMTVMGQL